MIFGGDRRMKRMVWVLLCVALLWLAVPALADDTYTVSDPASAGNIRTECEYLNIYCPAENGEQVTLSVYDQNGSCIYQRDYGASGAPSTRMMCICPCTGRKRCIP